MFGTLPMLFVTKSLNSTIESSGVSIGEDQSVHDFPGFRHWYGDMKRSGCNTTQGGALSPSLSNTCPPGCVQFHASRAHVPPTVYIRAAGQMPWHGAAGVVSRAGCLFRGENRDVGRAVFSAEIWASGLCDVPVGLDDHVEVGWALVVESDRRLRVDGAATLYHRHSQRSRRKCVWGPWNGTWSPIS